MSSVLHRLADVFVAPAGPEPAPDAASARPWARPTDRPTNVALLCGPREAGSLGAALALALARRARSPRAVLCLWAEPERPRPSVPATRAGRTLAASLEARGLQARAQGRLVRVVLPAEPGLAVAAGLRAAAVGAPTVVALARPRVAELDPLLDEQDLLLVAASADADPLIGALALDGLVDRRAPARLLPDDPGQHAGLLAGLGLGAGGGLASTLDAVEVMA